MTDPDEFDGDQCIILPSDYLNSAEAVAEIYEEELSAARNEFDIPEFDQPGFFKGCLLAAAIWILPGIWTVCL
jgi:hypothetical protein